MGKPALRQRLPEIYRRLLVRYGEQLWWPGDSPFEVMVGAILTQSAAWTNVEKAIDALKAAGALSAQALREISLPELARIIRASGYYNAKALKLKALAEWLGKRCKDNLDKLFVLDTDSLREELLGVHGVGEETADSILLYAGNKPIFVIDAYTRRILNRAGIKPKKETYVAYQALFMDNLPPDTQLFNEYHALLVCLGKNVCRKNQPLCEKCCLKELCRYSLEVKELCRS